MPIRPEDIVRTGNLELLSRHAVEGFITGFHKSPFHGFSVEFAEHRQYNPGESVQHMDWRLYARTDKLFVKRYEEETNLRCRLVIDASSSMQYDGGAPMTKLQFACWCAAVFVQLLKKQRDAVGMDLFDKEWISSSRTASSGRHYRSMWTTLEQTMSYQSSSKGTDLPTMLHDLAARLHRRSMVVLFADLLANSDQDEELFKAIQHMKHQKQELIIFHLLHRPTEFSFQFDQRPLVFEDLETGERMRLQANEVREQYREAMKERLKYLRLRCAQYKVDLVEVDTDKGVEEAIIPFLLKRNRMAR